MDAPELAQLIPEMMGRHPGHRWKVVSDGVTSEDVVVEISSVTAPERVASVTVMDSAEVFIFTFSGHSHAGFAYDDEARREELQDRLDLAVAATTGATRVVLDRCRGKIIGSRMWLDTDGANPREDTQVLAPGQLRAWLLRRLIETEVLDFAAVNGDAARS